MKGFLFDNNLPVWPRVEYLISRHKLVNVYRDRIEVVG
jgi:hypothetical protein